MALEDSSGFCLLRSDQSLSSRNYTHVDKAHTETLLLILWVMALRVILHVDWLI